MAEELKLCKTCNTMKWIADDENICYRCSFKSKNFLFICDYAQSRSKYFAEKFQEKGYNATYRGFSDEADYPLNEKIIDWSNVVVVLSNSWLYEPEFENWLKYAENTGKDIRYCMIDDEPRIFPEKLKQVLKWVEE